MTNELLRFTFPRSKLVGLTNRSGSESGSEVACSCRIRTDTLIDGATGGCAQATNITTTARIIALIVFIFNAPLLEFEHDVNFCNKSWFVKRFPLHFLCILLVALTGTDIDVYLIRGIRVNVDL